MRWQSRCRYKSNQTLPHSLNKWGCLAVSVKRFLRKTLNIWNVPGVLWKPTSIQVSIKLSSLPVLLSTLYVTCVFVTLLMATFGLQTSHSQKKPFRTGSYKVLRNLPMSPEINSISQTILLFPLLSCTILYFNATLGPMIPHRSLLSFYNLQ